MEAIAREGKHQHLIIESTGISDPTPVAEALAASEGSSTGYYEYLDGEDDDSVNASSSSSVGEREAPVERSTSNEDEAGGDLAAARIDGSGEGGATFTLDTLVTVVDSTSFLDEVRKADDLEERGLEAQEGDTRTIADLLVSQVRTL